MKNRKSLIDEIHELEQKIFKEFALETSNNIHVEAVDLKNPLTSIIKILISDLISSQLYADNEMPKIIPKQILIKDEQNKKYSHFHFNDEGIKYLKKQFEEVKKTKTDEEMSAIFEKFRSEILNINKEVNIIDWHSVLYQNISENTFTNQYFTYCRLQDAAYTKYLTHPSNQIDFNNTDSKHYKDIRADEKINYSIFFDYEISDNNAGFDNEKTKIFITKIAALALHTKRNRQNFREIENQATRAAISQVMARNTSHNIGAHVMNKLIGDLSKQDIKSFKNYISGIDLFKDETDNNKILLDQISIFNNYVKCRMDYLADFSFGTPLMQTNKYAYADLFKELDKVRLLLEHISGLDNFKFEIKFTRNGKEFKKDNQGEGEEDLLVAIPNDILGTQAFYNILENIIRNTAKHSDKSKLPEGKNVVFTVSFIDDVKSVKDFCEDDKCDKTQCTKAHKKEIDNALNEFIAVEVYDNIPVDETEKEIKLEDKEISEYKRMMGKNEPEFKTSIDYLVFNQNKKLNEDILQENKLRSYSLGLVEMDASAAYLRKRPVEYINHHSYDIQYDESWSRNTEKNEKDKNGLRGTNYRHFLKAFRKEVIKDDSKTESYLGYRFFLHRPAVVLVVTELLKDEKKKEKLKKEGIWVVTKEEFEKHLNPENGKNDGKVYPHEFVIHTDLSDYTTKVKIKDVETEVKLLEYFKTSLPVRILELKNNELSEILDNDAEKIVSDCWIKWFDKLKQNNICSNHTSDHSNRFYSIKGTYNESACHSIVLIDHLYKDDGSPDIEKAKQLWEELEKKECHAEALSSLAQSKLPNYYKIVNLYCKNEIGGKKMFQCYLQKMHDIVKQQIAESVFAKVVVIDERIQESSETRDFMTIKFDRLYQKMKVIIPKKSEINLSACSYDSVLINNLKQYLGLQIEENEKNCNIQDITIGLNENDFILIHYSIFERMFKKEEINGMIEYIANKGINVVLTSGRGTPENLTTKARFVNLSSVINSFVDVRSKYLINYLLNSSRKSNKI